MDLKLLSVIEDMAYQFAYETKHRGRAALTTGGLSALESAFDALAWRDPHPIPESECQTRGCHERASCGTPTKDGYRRLCGRHYSDEQECRR
jgi:hypothetical protein